jgi:hypothetical protein
MGKPFLFPQICVDAQREYKIDLQIYQYIAKLDNGMECSVEARDVQIVVEESKMKFNSELVDLLCGIVTMGTNNKI